MSVISLADKRPLPSIVADCSEENIVYLPVAPQIVGRSRFAPLQPTDTVSKDALDPKMKLLQTLAVPERILRV